MMPDDPHTGTAPDQPDEPEMVTLLCIGGPRAGEELSIPAGIRYWVDLRSAQTYRRQWFSTRSTHTGRPVQLWRRYALVWDPIAVDQSIALLADWLIAQWVMAGGEQIPVSSSSIELAAPTPDPNGSTPQ